MPTIKYLNRLKLLDELIKLKITGSPKELANKLEISERQIFRYIGNLQDLGGEIKFDRYRNSYAYKSDTEFIIGYVQKNKDKITD